MTDFTKAPSIIPRYIGRAAAGASRLAAALALLGLSAWVVGRVLTDTHPWSQYCFWIPTLPLAAGVILAGLISQLLARLTRGMPTRGKSPGRHLRILCWLGGAAAIVHAFAVEWRGPGGAPSPGAARILFWNDSEGLLAQWEKPMLDEQPDVAVMKPGNGRFFANFMEKMGVSPESGFVYTAGFAVTTKFPIKRWVAFPMGIEQGAGLDPRRSDFHRRERDPGWAMLLHLDAKSKLGRDLIVWLVDLPSDLSLWRMTEAREGLASIRQFCRQAPEFETPDLILGDFNTPRGAASSKELSLGYASAYDQAGHGYSATFPRTRPLWHLDQTFVGPGLRATDYRIIDAGGGSHRMQVTDVENRK